MAAAPMRPSHHKRTAMTSKLPRQTTDSGKPEMFPDFPPRDDMQNSLHLDQPAHQAILRQHFGSYDTTIVLSEMPVRWSPGQTEGHRIPDLLIAFDVDFSLADGIFHPGPGQAAGLRAGDSLSEHGTAGTTPRSGTTTPPSAYPNTGGSTHRAGGITMRPWPATSWWKGRTSPSRYGRQGRVTSTPGGYCGITNNPTRRAGEHRRAGRKGAMRLVGRRTTRAGARAWEGRMGCHKQKPRGGR